MMANSHTSWTETVAKEPKDSLPPLPPQFGSGNSVDMPPMPPDGFGGPGGSGWDGGYGSIINIYGGTITTSARGCISIFATDSATILATDVKIDNAKDMSRGVHATYNGTIIAYNPSCVTAGTSSSTIATDRGDGTVVVEGGSYTAKGRNSAVPYSTGDIVAKEIKGLSEIGEIGVIEGDNSVNIYNCEMTSGSTKRAIMMLQSGSGDAHGYNGTFNVADSKLTVLEAATAMLEVPTNMTGTLTLTDVELVAPSGVLMYVDYNTQWRTYGGTGDLVLATKSKLEYNGDVLADNTGHANVAVGSGVTWNGSINNDNVAASANVKIEEGGCWNLTADCYVDSLENLGSIYKNGFALTVK